MEVRTPTDLATRVQVVRRRDDFERDPAAFVAAWDKQDAALRRRILKARERLKSIATTDATLERAAQLCMQLGTDGLRGELTLVRAARAYAAYENDHAVTDAHLRRVAPAALRHRLRRNPLEEAGSSVRVERAIEACFGA